MTFLSNISKIFDRTLELLSNKKQTPQAGLKYDEIGIFNKFLSEDVLNMYLDIPDIPPRDMSTSSETLYKTQVMASEKPDIVVQLPAENSEVSKEKLAVKTTEPVEDKTADSVEEKSETPIEEPPYVQGKNEDITVHKTVNGKEVTFTYNIAGIEDYITQNSYQGYFKNIPEIRAKAPEDRTDAETKLLEEFDNLVEYIVNAGVEYGVDPNFIAAIIQKEVGFAGLRKGATGVNGKGHMQLTTIAIKDMFLHPSKYGEGLAELMASRGFDLNCPKSQRDDMVKKVMAYLKENKDPEFNIGLGTIKLRRLLEASNGNKALAAYNYNGNKKHDVRQPDKEVREIYRDRVSRYYDALRNHRAEMC